jgi:predicted O-methyltransferase YrrM
MPMKLKPAMFPSRVNEMVQSFRTMRVIFTALELGIFSLIEKTSLDSGAVAIQIGSNPRATDRLMNALAAIGLLVKEKNVFRNSKIASRFFVKGKPDYMGGLLHQANLIANWNTLTEAVIRGTSVIKREENIRKEGFQKNFIDAMHLRGKQQAEIVAASFDLSKISRILDIGGGSGVFSMAFARVNPMLNIVVFDLPEVVEIAREYIESEGLSTRVKTEAGDFRIVSFGNGYDMIFLSAIIHMNGPEENLQLFRKCRDALNTGGLLVVKDHIMDDSRIMPVEGAFFALNMLVNTEKGDTYTESEIISWSEVTGFSRVYRKDVSGGITLMIAER